MDCPNCDEPDMIFLAGDDDEPDIHECPDCGTAVVTREPTNETEGAPRG